MNTLTREQCQALWDSLPGADKPVRYAKAVIAHIGQRSTQEGISNVLADLLRSALGPLKTQSEVDQLDQLISHIESALDAYDAGRLHEADEDVQDKSRGNV
jgi:hypothetical protein